MPVLDGPEGFNLGRPGPLRVGLLACDVEGVCCVKDDEFVVPSYVSIEGDGGILVDSTPESEKLQQHHYLRRLIERTA